MIKDIQELNFPEYATLSSATVTLNDMGDRTISAQVKIDGSLAPDFSYDWEVEFQGERYIQPLREPQASKGNESICSVIDLVFQHKTIYELKRYYFAKMAEVESGTTSAESYIADLSVNLGQFCVALQDVLSYYYRIGYLDEPITVNLNQDWQYNEEPQYVQIQYTHIWDVVQKIYDLFGVRWSIECREIKIGYPTEEVAHTFEYGFEGGLLRVERQVQSADIRNSLLGRGGSKNLPYRYFKDTDPQNPSFQADPDWIPELANIYFSELRGKTFRDYVKGWKAKHYGGEPMQEPTEAYTKGYTDTEFNPVEYVEDEESIEKYGLLQGGLENQEDIYPTIQGVEVDGLGRIDEIVGATQVIIDEAKGADLNSAPISNVVPKTTLINGNTSKSIYEVQIQDITIPDGYIGLISTIVDTKVDYVFGMDDNPTRIDSLPNDVSMEVGVDVKVDGLNSNYLPNGTHSVNYVITITRSTADYHSSWYGAYVTVTPPQELKLIYGEILSINKTSSIKVEGGNTNRLSIKSEQFQIKEGGATQLDIPIKVTTDDINIGQFTWEKDIRIVNVNTGETLSSINIPEGNYDCEIIADISNLSDTDANFELSVGDSVILYPTDSEEWQPTFAIWVKNIWNTTRNVGESDQAYVDRVWTPILGDREGNEAKVVFTTGWLAGHSDYEFVIRSVEYAGGSGVELDGIPAEWKITLVKSDAEIEATGKWIPSTTQQAVKGDKFFFIGIDMPHEYTLWAEQAVDNFKADQLLRTAHIKPTWVVQTDKVRLNQLQPNETEPLLEALKAGNSIHLADTRFIEGAYEKLYLQSVTYTWDAQTTMYPNVEVVLSDKVVTTTNPVAQLQGEVDALTKQVGSLSNMQQIVRAVGDKTYLRKDGIADTSNSETTFNKPIHSRNFQQGAIGGSGWGLREENGKGIIEADTIIARYGLQVNNLIINQIASIAGTNIISAANMECSKVEMMDNAIRCYFDQRQGSISNHFVERDIAYSQVFSPNNVEIKYYKREVIDIGSNYIDLSTTNYDGDGAPQEGDTIVQMGNFDDTSRQGIIIISSNPVPSITQYQSVNSFTLPTPITKISPNDNVLTGRVHIQAGSTGVENLEGLPEIVQEAVTGIEVGGQNLLRNSGFTGDYLSEQLADDSVLDATNQMFNPPFVHWEYSNATIQDSIESASGKEVVLNNGSLTQTLDFPIVANDTYMLSFKAKGTSLTYQVGGVQKTITLTNGWSKFVETINTTVKSDTFSISGDGTLCEIQLERGTVATAWSNSPFDNASDRAYYQSLKYLNQALNEGSTTIDGGLVLTTHIKVGNYDDGVMIKETGGMQGTWSSDNSPFLWGGGTHEQALDTINKYTQNPHPTDAELADMAKFVVTHGGRAILNDIILRGYIYALGGEFVGMLRKRKTVINNDNFAQYFTLLTDTGGQQFYALDIEKAGSFIAFDASLSNSNFGNSNWLYVNLPNTDTDDLDFARSFIGNEILVYNYSNYNISLCNAVTCTPIESGRMAMAKCTLIQSKDLDGNVIYDSDERIAWEIKTANIKAE